MTKEKIIRNLKYTMEKHKNDTVSTFGTNISVMCKDILDYLEQEPIGNVFDKIKAEIDAKAFHFLRLQNMQRVHGLEDALEIIEKYRKESED